MVTWESTEPGCVLCAVPTQLYFNDIPICLTCAEALGAKTKPAQNDLLLSLAHEGAVGNPRQ